jgi:hypothetical protein
MKEGVYWFKHDYDAIDDDKITIIIDQLGLEGYGIYWMLIEKLRGRDDFKMPFTTIPSLARKYCTTSEKIKAIVTQYNLFEYDEEGFFFSRSLIERMQSWIDLKEKRSLAGKKGNEARWGSNLIANESQTDSNAIAIRKEKKRKEEENKFSFKQALLDLGVEQQLVDDWLLVRKGKKATNTETAFNSIKKQIELSNADANDCIRVSVERSWSGFKAEWYNNIKKEENINVKQQPKKVEWQ